MPRIGAYLYNNELPVFIDEDDVGDITRLTEFQKVTDVSKFTNTKTAKRVTYTPDELFTIAKVLINKNPPDQFEAINKVWMGLSFTIKTKYFEALEQDLRSHYSHELLCDFLIEAGTTNYDHQRVYMMTFKELEILHEQQYDDIIFEQNHLELIFDKSLFGRPSPPQAFSDWRPLFYTKDTSDKSKEITDRSKLSSPTKIMDRHKMPDPSSIFTTSSTSDSKSLLLNETTELQYNLSQEAQSEESLASDIAPSSPTSATKEKIEQCRIQGSFHDAISHMSSEEILGASEYSDNTEMGELLDKALEYSNENNTETALKYIWLTVSLRVKKLFLEACRCDIRSSDAISLLGRLAISSAGLGFCETYKYMDAIDFADDARQAGHIPFGKEEIADGISSIRSLLTLLDGVNKNKETINKNFEKYYASKSRKEHGNVLWDGTSYEYTTIADNNIV